MHLPLVLSILALLNPVRPADQPVAPPMDTVNAVLGDQSFVASFGRAPSVDDDEGLRLRTHLIYVERLLRARDVSTWDARTQSARGHTLDNLRAYIQRGKFPRNHDLPARRPCFIDRDGNICAVGYLVEVSAGRDVAEAINAQFQYAAIRQMDIPVLADWLEAAGLTELEAAMIQPGYAGVEQVSVQGGGGTAFATPGMTGPTLGDQQLTIQIRLIDLDFGDPIAGYPRQDIFLLDAVTSSFCNGGSIADANTDADGWTTISGALGAGGQSPSLRIYVGGVPDQEIPLAMNSPDLNGDLHVGLPDVALMAGDFASLGYHFRSDLSGDGALGLADVASMAIHVGESCP